VVMTPVRSRWSRCLGRLATGWSRTLCPPCGFADDIVVGFQVNICGKKRSHGRFTVLRHTIRKRMQAKLQEVKAELRRRMHQSIREQGAWLRSGVGGHVRYYGVPTNTTALCTFRWQVGRLWLRTLRRRSQRHRLPWARMQRLIDRWLPAPRVCHPYPLRRFGVIS